MYLQEILKHILKLIENQNVKLTNLIDQMLLFYESRCKCKEEFLLRKKRKPSGRRKPFKPLKYPISNEIEFRTFQIKYERKLSLIAKSILNSFHHKYLFYAIDDILYLLKLNPIERNNLLAIIYSPALSLHNNFSINFFNIWIEKIYISEVSKGNKFLNNNCQNFESFSYITIKFLYITNKPIKQKESWW